MTDLYIATPTRADYDALMRLAEAAGYKWRSGSKPTEGHKFDRFGCETVVWMRENMLLEYCDKPYYEDNQGVKIETIPNLANIKAIWKVSRENRNAFTMKHRLPPHYKSARKLYVICDEYSGTYLTKENEIYEALAVEYKPQESEDMPEKVKLPKRLYDALQDYGLLENGNESWPVGAISGLYDQWREEESSVLGTFIDGNADNQWLLIDAVRYGYEPEPEPLYYVIMPIDRTHCFLNQNEDDGEVFFDEKDAVMRIKVKFTIPEILAIDPRYKAFAVPVEEVDGNE
ncbi:DUF1642 domain-containing protein [Latilactobacillus sakei]|uniref:DUF1642 domain-containing protein n=1 Tax=Latilactobacillus sakei TaxID=1599 RepID=UPI003F532962